MLTRILSITLSTKAARRSNKLNPPKLLLVAKEGFFMSKFWQSSFCFFGRYPPLAGQAFGATR